MEKEHRNSYIKNSIIFIYWGKESCEGAIQYQKMQLKKQNQISLAAQSSLMPFQLQLF